MHRIFLFLEKLGKRRDQISHLRGKKKEYKGVSRMKKKKQKRNVEDS